VAHELGGDDLRRPPVEAGDAARADDRRQVGRRPARARSSRAAQARQGRGLCAHLRARRARQGQGCARGARPVPGTGQAHRDRSRGVSISDQPRLLRAADHVRERRHRICVVSNPVAKTFYTHRVFLVYQPDDYRKYLMDRVDTEHWPKAEAERFQLRLGLLAWGTILVYRARMIPFDFNRELKRLVDEKGQFIEQDPSIPVTRPILRQQLAMQLAVEVITRQADVKERIAEVPLFQQYIYDTLYWPSFFHEKGQNDGKDDAGKPVDFVLTGDKLRQHLWFRAKGVVGTPPEDNFAPPNIMEFLFCALEDYLDLLREPDQIRGETINYARQLEHDQDLWVALAETIDTAEPLVSLEKIGIPRRDARHEEVNQEDQKAA